GTYCGGLAMFDNEKKQFRCFTEQDGLQNTTIYQILEDCRGCLWLSTNTGISKLNTSNYTFKNFTRNNGVLNNNFFHGSGIKLSNGELLFGGPQGFNYFNPTELTINHNVPAVLLTDL